MDARDHIDSKDYGNLLCMFLSDIEEAKVACEAGDFKKAHLHLEQMRKNLKRLKDHDIERATK